MKIHLLATGAVAVLALAGCATSPGGGYGSGGGYSQPSRGYSDNRCVDCGIVTRIDTVASGRTAPTATGAILGGIVGVFFGRSTK